MCEKTCEVSGCFHECQQLATHQSALRAKHSYLATDINAAEVASNLSYMHRHRQTAVRGLNTFHGPLCPWSHLSGSFEAFLSACCLEPFFPACFSLSWPACLYPPLACHLCQPAAWAEERVMKEPWSPCSLQLSKKLSLCSQQRHSLGCCIFCSDCRATTSTLHSPTGIPKDFLAIMHTGRYQLLCVVAIVVHNDTSTVYHYTCNSATCKQQLIQ